MNVRQAIQIVVQFTYLLHWMQPGSTRLTMDDVKLAVYHNRGF